MKVRIQLLKTFGVFREGEALTDRLSKGQVRILAYLATRDGDVTRRKACRDLWPEELDFTVTSNRLRVALSRLRTDLPGVLTENRELIGLNRDLTETDLGEVERILRESRDFVAEDQELEAAWPTILQLEHSLLPEVEADWAEDARQTWRSQAFRFALRLAELAHPLENFARARTAARCALAHKPESDRAWRIFLEASAHLDEGARALASWQEFSKGPNALPADQAEQLGSLAKAIKAGHFPSQPHSASLTGSEKALVGEMFERILALRPALAREILASPEALPVAAKDPRLMSTLLNRVIENSDTQDETWARCAARAIGCRAWINDFAGVLELAPRVLGAIEHPLIRRAVFNALSVAKSLQRDWKGAMQAIDEAIAIASTMPDPIERLSGEGNKASFLWLQGQYQEAIALFDSCLQQLRTMEGDRALTELTVCLGNRAFVPVMQGDFAKGLEWMEEAMAFRRSNGLGIAGELATPCLAMLRLIHGERESAVELMRDGLVALYQSGSARSQQIGLEYGAGALVALGDRESADRLIDWVNDWRVSTGLLRAPAEDQLMASILALPAERNESVSSFDIAPSDSPQEVAHRLMRQLRLLCRNT